MNPLNQIPLVQPPDQVELFAGNRLPLKIPKGRGYVDTFLIRNLENVYTIEQSTTASNAKETYLVVFS